MLLFSLHPFFQIFSTDKSDSNHGSEFMYFDQPLRPLIIMNRRMRQVPSRLDLKCDLDFKREYLEPTTLVAQFRQCRKKPKNQ